MVHNHYFLQSDTDAETAPVFIVKVGQRRKDIVAHAEISARALVSDKYYYNIVDNESSEFFHKLLVSNPNREIFRCYASELLNLLNGANAAHVENLSDRSRRQALYVDVQSHKKAIKPCHEKNLSKYLRSLLAGL